MWSVERFYYYLAGLKFELVTDHKPLEVIFKPTSRPPARIERWLLRLQSFTFNVIYRAGRENIADSISRLCKIEVSASFDESCEQGVFQIIDNSTSIAMTISEIATHSLEDRDIVDAIEYIKADSWPSDITNIYYPFRYELLAVENMLIRGSRLVIPKSLRGKVLSLAHEGHPGESAMKRRLRSKVWWPMIDRDVEKFVKTCFNCLLVSRPNNPAPMDRHVFPNGPWQCVASDLLGPIPNGDYLFVLIDYYSRYQEIRFTKKITSDAIIKFLREIFSRLGFPKTLRADNGRQYISAEFKDYCKYNNIQLINTPPYWPQANGEVENMNKSLVKRLKIAHSNNKNYKEEIEDFILMYNVTPHGTTGAAPSELMFNRVIRDKIPTIDDVTNEMWDSAARDMDIINKQKGKEKGDTKRHAKDSEINVGDQVVLKNVVFPHKLTPTFGQQIFDVVERNGNEVKVSGNGKIFRRNISHVKRVLKPDATIMDHDVTENELSKDLPMNVTSNSNSAVGQLKKPVTNNELPIDVPMTDDDAACDVAAPNPKLILKLKNKGGMWRPAAQP